jgi:hypothetical protein
MLSVQEKTLGETFDLVLAFALRFVVDDDRVGDPIALNHLANILLSVIDRDADYLKASILKLCMQRLKSWHLLDTGSAPCCPEIHEK